jgi:hypothetical protein
VGDSENALPNHQRRKVVSIDNPASRAVPPAPAMIRTYGEVAIDIDRLADILARLLGLSPSCVLGQTEG